MHNNPDIRPNTVHHIRERASVLGGRRRWQPLKNPIVVRRIHSDGYGLKRTPIRRLRLCIC